MFTKGFDKYVSEGDSITCEVDGFEARATLYYDDDTTAPDKRQDGFWPSLDPKDHGYIGSKSKSTLARRMAEAKEVMRAWKADEWHYFGVAVTVFKDGIQLTGKYDHALWGVEGNYPGSDNGYLLHVANENLGEAIADAKSVIAKLCTKASA